MNTASPAFNLSPANLDALYSGSVEKLRQTFCDRLIRALLLRRCHTGALGSVDSRRAFLRTIVLGGATLPFIPGALERIVLSSHSPHNDLIPLMSINLAALEPFMSQPILRMVEHAPSIGNLFGGESLDRWTITSIGAPTAISLLTPSPNPLLSHVTPLLNPCLSI
jgi:hypothetical protein